MLDELIVRNLGVISSARIQPGPGFTVITGETGTGKTILVGALRMLLGGAARSDLVGPFGEEAAVEGRFVGHDGAEIVAGRRLSRNGRSRAYLDSSMASAAALDQATAGLVDIVGQHDQLSLTRSSEVRRLVDGLLDENGRRTLAEYQDAWEHLRALRSTREALGGDRPGLERERMLAEQQAAEIAGARIDVAEEEALEHKLTRLRHADQLRENLGRAAGALDPARDGLGRAVGELRRAAGLDPGLDDLAQRLAILEIEAGEIAADLAAELEEIEADPAALEAAEQRRHQLVELRRRYGPELSQVVAFGENAARRAVELGELLSRSDRIEADLDDALSRTRAAGEKLGRSRREAAGRLCSSAIEHLKELGLTDPLLDVQFESGEPTATGTETLTFRFASDSRLPLGDISKVASGGELSRLVLALRLAGGSTAAPVLVFDEIDAGVGGATALAVGKKLAGLARDHQVLAVTHLPQVAAFAQHHYVVRRGEREAGVTLVESAQRVEELARMLAGLPDSERGREAAEELWELARRAGER